jgi:hypothetical protein
MKQDTDATRHGKAEAKQGLLAVEADRYTIEALRSLKRELVEREVKKDLSMLKKHGVIDKST